MKKLGVYITSSPNENRLVGELAESGRRIYFEYASAFLQDPLWLSPFKLPPEPGLHEHRDLAFGPLFGLFDDSLPDGWGLLLMDQHFRQQEIAPDAVTPLDRLAYMGNRTVGALTYHPPAQIAEQGNRLLDLHEMVSGVDPLPEGYAGWIVKFPSQQDAVDEGRVEYAYSQMAKEAGIAMPASRLFTTTEGDSFFGVERFDREQNLRRHVHTFGNLIHSNFRIPGCDYQQLLKTTRILTKNQADVTAAFRLMVFNILAHNRDDHVKNFAFMLDARNDWRLTPAYDLTFTPGPGGEHTMTVAGEGREPSREHILHIAEGAGINRRRAIDILDEVASVVADWSRFARGEAGLPSGVILEIKQAIQACLRRTLC